MSEQSRCALLLTRTRRQSERFVAELGATTQGRFDQVVIAPLTKTVLLKNPVVREDELLVATSENVFRVLPEAIFDAGRKVICVGNQTAKMAKKYGLDPVSAEGNAVDLARMLQNLPGPKCHLSGAHVASEALDQVSELRREIIYRQDPLPPESTAKRLLSTHPRIILPLFSARSAHLFIEAYAPAGKNIHVVAISEAAAEPCRTAGVTKISIAQRPDAHNMKEVVLELLQD